MADAGIELANYVDAEAHAREAKKVAERADSFGAQTLGPLYPQYCILLTDLALVSLNEGDTRPTFTGKARAIAAR